MPPENRKQFEYEAFWSEWVNLKGVYQRHGTLSDPERRSLADVVQWAAEQGIDHIMKKGMEILEATEVVETSDGVTFSQVSGNAYWLIKALVLECIESRPYEMSLSEAQRFVKIHNNDSKRTVKITWSPALRPVLHPDTVQIARIQEISNEELEGEFAEYVKSTTFNPLDSVEFIAPNARTKMQAALAGGKGHFLFHGTSVLGVKGISKAGFDPKRCNISHDLFGDRYGSLGQGAYLSDNFAKCAAYARCNKCDAVTCACDSERPVLVCLVRYTNHDGIKNLKTYGRRYRDVESLIKKQHEKGTATTIARGTSNRGFLTKTLDLKFGNNDFLVYRRDMALPMYVVWYKRKPAV